MKTSEGSGCELEYKMNVAIRGLCKYAIHNCGRIYTEMEKFTINYAQYSRTRMSMLKFKPLHTV